MNDQTPIIRLKGIGEKTSGLFQKLGVATVGGLLRHYPRDYERFCAPVPISQAAPGEICAVCAEVAQVPVVREGRNLTMLHVVVKDASASMLLIFFNMVYLKNSFKSGVSYVFRGLVQSRGTARLMEQPKIFSPLQYESRMETIQPCYALTKGLTNQSVQKAVKQALSFYEWEEEYYPAPLVQRYGLVSRREAVCGVHFPEDDEKWKQARRRLVFDEFFDFLFFLRQNRDLAFSLPNGYPMEETGGCARFLRQLPFRLTGAQEKVWEEIQEDLSGTGCMNRLIQGDVGSGKTIVALLALLLCVQSGYQGAFMAPTEVLAMQHYQSFRTYTDRYGLPFRPVLLTGSMTAKQKREARLGIESGEVNLVIGTHALIQEKILFRCLALAITDEQHRFGVRQREQLAGKGNVPHILVMSATPIPRTLAIILYGDLHLSVIHELPQNRLPIKSCVVNTSYRHKAYEFLAREIKAGRQAYVICPMVDEGEAVHLENVMQYTRKLKATLPEEIRLASLHGKMKPAEKNRIMEAFSAGQIDLLVSTTVVEVGIDVPNASVMLVENAERFGLAQLHQLRGRVGRGLHQSYCIFVSTKETKETMARLNILTKSGDGFWIASEDLKLRGPGDLFGIRQSGDFAFRMGDIYQDMDILRQASEAVDSVFEAQEYPPLRRHILAQSSGDRSTGADLSPDDGNMVDFRSI
jgi:ATP-dependent DNA helicase RecG